MQQPRPGSIRKPHKLEEPCGLFHSKPKLFATYTVKLSLFFSPVKKRCEFFFVMPKVVDPQVIRDLSRLIKIPVFKTDNSKPDPISFSSNLIQQPYYLINRDRETDVLRILCYCQVYADDFSVEI